MVRFSSNVYTVALAKLPLHQCDMPTLGLLLKAMLAVVGRWFKSITKDVRKDFTAFWLLLFAAKVLEALGLGKVAVAAHLPRGIGDYKVVLRK